MDTSYIQKNVIVNKNSPFSIEIKNGDFAWEKNSKEEILLTVRNSVSSIADLRDQNGLILDSLNIQIPKGKLVAVIGDVGSGKSSFLYAMIGEMIKKNPLCSIYINGQIALVNQKPWILNGSVRDNIIFGKEFNS